MSTPDYTKLVQGQRRYFKAGKTRPVSWRVEQLKAIKAMIEARRGAIREALWHDLRRNETDADLAAQVWFCSRWRQSCASQRW